MIDHFYPWFSGTPKEIQKSPTLIFHRLYSIYSIYPMYCPTKSQVRQDLRILAQCQKTRTKTLGAEDQTWSSDRTHDCHVEAGVEVWKCRSAEVRYDTLCCCLCQEENLPTLQLYDSITCDLHYHMIRPSIR